MNSRFGSDKLRKDFLEPSIRGDFVACLGVSEPGGGMYRAVDSCQGVLVGSGSIFLKKDGSGPEFVFKKRIESSLNIQLQNSATIEIFVQYVLKAVAIKFEYHNLYMVSILMFDSQRKGKDAFYLAGSGSRSRSRS